VNVTPANFFRERERERERDFLSSKRSHNKEIRGNIFLFFTIIEKLRRRSWKWWFWHYNGFNIKAFLLLKRLSFKKSMF